MFEKVANSVPAAPWLPGGVQEVGLLPGVGGDERVAVISAGRPHMVPDMATMLGELAKDATWYVPEGQGDDYLYAGAPRVRESGGLVDSRNAALREAWEDGSDCLQLSDDLRALRWNGNGQGVIPMPVSSAVEVMSRALDTHRCYLAGVAPTDNAFFGSTRVKTAAFIVADMILVRPCGIFFDRKLKLKEDYDYTLKHLQIHGKVARCDSILASFAHKTNPGGVCNYRTEEHEQEAIQYLKQKWPENIVDNPRRPNEVLLRWKESK